MARRIQVRPLADPQPFRPTASPEGTVVTERTRPIDTFVAPSVKRDPNAGQGLSELARSLSAIAPGLQRFAVQHLAETNADQTEAGRQKAAQIREAGLSFKQAVDQGIIKPSDNPFFRAGVREQLGEASAHDFSAALQNHIDADPELKTSTDPTLFEAKVSRFREEWMSENIGAGNRDKFFDNTFARTADALVGNLRSQFAQQSGARLEELSEQAHFTNTKAMLREDIKNGVKPADIAAALNQKMSDLRMQGQNPMVLARSTAQAFMSLADELVSSGRADEAYDVAHTLQSITVDGKDVRDYDPKIAEAINGLPDKLLVADFEHQKLTKARRQFAEEDRVETAQVAIAKDLYETHGANLKTILQSVSDIPRSAESLERTVSAIRSTAENPEERVRQQRQIWLHPDISVDDIFKLPALGPNDVAFLVNQVQERDAKAQQALNRSMALEDRQDRLEEKDMRRKEHAAAMVNANFNHPVFRMQFQRIPSRLALGELDAKFVDPTVRADAIEEAQYQVSQAWLDYMAGPGKDADNGTRMEWLKKTVDDVVDVQRSSLNDAVQGTGKGAPFQLPTSRVLNDDDLQTFARSGKLTPHMKATLDSLKIPKEPKVFASFLRSQAALRH